MGTILSISVGEVASFQANKAFTAFNVADNAYAITSGLKTLSSATKLGTITLTGPSPLEVTGNDFTAYATVLHKLAKGTPLSVAAATVAQAAKAQADAAVTSISVADSAANIAASLAALATETKLASIWVTSGTLSVTAATFGKYQSTLDKLVNGQAFNVTGATVAQAAALQADSHCGGFTVTDSGANILANLATLAKDGKLTGMSLTTAGPLALTWDQFNTYMPTLDKFTNASFTFASLTAGQSMGVLGDSHLGSVNVVDTLVNVQNQLSGLALHTHLASLKLSDASSITVTGGNDFQQYQGVLDKLVAGQGFVASGITAAQAAKAQADTHCSAFSVADTAANVLANASALNRDSHLTSVRLTDGPLTLTQAQFAADAALVSKLAEGSAVKVTGVTAANAAAVAGNAHVWQVGVSDTLANIGARLDALEALAKGGHLSGIAVTDSGKSLTLTAAQYAADADAIRLMTGRFTLNHPPAGNESAAAEAAPSDFTDPTGLDTLGYALV